MGQKIEIGKIFLTYNDENQGTLEMEFELDIDPTEEDIDGMRKYLTKINNIIVPRINQKLREDDEKDDMQNGGSDV